MGKLVWLASYPKSGSTWVRVFLHNYITQPDTPHDINRLHEFSVSECNAVFFKKYDARPASAYATQDVQRMRPAVHRDFMNLHDDLVFVKTHNAMLAVHDVALCAPEVTAGAVYVVRDPRDVAVSYSRYAGRDIDEVIAFMAASGAANRGTDTQVFEYLGPWSKHAESWVKQKKRLLMRYEDLLAAPAQHFGRLIEFLGDSPDPERLSRAIAFSNFKILAGQETAKGYVAGGPNAASPFFRAGQTGQWKAALSPAQIARIETDHGAMMKNFGYL